jgi:hypothetical protein
MLHLQAASGVHMPIEGWHYTPKNALMYVKVIL